MARFVWRLRSAQSTEDDRRALDRHDGDMVKLVWLALAAAAALVDVARAQAPQILLQQYKCYICHADDEYKTGPAYADVATR
jgi:cytochrome c551/c552